MGILSRLAGLAALLATAGCVQPAQWYQPPVSGLGPPVPLNALPPPVMVAPRLPERFAPPLAALPPLEEPAYAEPAQPPFSDGSPFADGAPFLEDMPSYAEPAAPAVEAPRPALRAAEPTPAVPMVGFRPMRSPGSR